MDTTVSDFAAFLCLFSVYTISNSVQFDMPVAGGEGMTIPVMMAVAFLAMGFGVMYFTRKRRRVYSK